ncbi:hypothetical protein HHK36_000618 [Tetracentron sinense]|uniref:Uncharacterized protein n=1 Tax=Tetracentron sinense TaxID=13715 RepID=A0A834ZVU1_TETSI|nr:hypothetical protein HHK36_000618 [Tetracentron sinense]
MADTEATTTSSPMSTFLRLIAKNPLLVGWWDITRVEKMADNEATTTSSSEHISVGSCKQSPSNGLVGNGRCVFFSRVITVLTELERAIHALLPSDELPRIPFQWVGDWNKLTALESPSGSLVWCVFRIRPRCRLTVSKAFVHGCGGFSQTMLFCNLRQLCYSRVIMRWNSINADTFVGESYQR